MTVHVIGNVTEDLVFRVGTLPREGETLIAQSRLADIGGKGLNQAIILARAGCGVRLCAPVGDDDAGRRAQALVDREIPGTALHVVNTPTDQSIITVSSAGENHIVSSAFAADSLQPEDIHAALAGMTEADTLVLQGNLGADATRAALETARSAGARTVANPSPIRWDWSALWPLIDLVILNRQELVALSGTSDLDDGIAVLRSAGVAQVLVTLGAEGAVLVGSDETARVAAEPVHVVDTAGAGDTFCGVFVAASAAGQAAATALAMAARAAGMTVSRHGTLSAFPGREALSAVMTETAP